MVKKSKNSDNHKKSQNFIFFSKKLNLKKKKIFKKKNKCYPLSFTILGGRDSTRALQSSLFQKYENFKKSPKITFFQKKKGKFWKYFFLQNKKAILLVLPIEEISLRPDLSSPPRFRTHGGYPERDGVVVV